MTKSELHRLYDDMHACLKWMILARGFSHSEAGQIVAKRAHMDYDAACDKWAKAVNQYIEEQSEGTIQ